MSQNEEHDNQQAYFARVAANYDRLQPIVAGPAYNSGLNMIVDLMPYGFNDSFQFIELGCGTAELTARILNRYPKANGIAIDNELEMLDIASKKIVKYGNRGQTILDDIACCNIPGCHVVVSSKAFHHLPPERLNDLFEKIAAALFDNGCFILLDHMLLGPFFGKNIRMQSQRIYTRNVASAIEAGKTTQKEIDDRWEFKRKMKADGKDVEYWHSADNILNTLAAVGFSEAGVVWRMFADTILVGFKA